jgi:hypothetical protein
MARVKAGRLSHVATQRIPLTIYSICAYFTEGCRPPLVDFSFTLDGREYFATVASSRHARLTTFDQEIFEQEVQVDTEGRYRVYVPTEEIGVLEVVDAAKVVLERFHERRLTLNNFEVVSPPGHEEIQAAHEHWLKLAHS